MDLLDRCRERSDEQLDREFDIGPRTVRATLVRNVEVWTDLIAEQPIRPGGDDALGWERQLSQTVRMRG